MKKYLLLISFLFVAGFSMSQKIKAYEYWMDDNIAGKVSTDITPVKHFHLQADLPMNSVSTGFHLLNMRFIDSTNRWSSVLTQYFMKYPASPASKQIVAYEYWIDDNYAGKIFNTVSPTSVYHLTENLDLTSAANGFHLLNLRFKDSSGAWSGVLTQYFMKYPTNPTESKQIIAYEYWVDDGYAGKIAQTVTPTSVYHFTENLDLTSAANGFHLLNLRFKDNTGAWSGVLTQYFMKFPTNPTESKQIIAYEYWVDDGYAGKIAQAVTPTSVYHLTENLDLTSAANGFHLLNLRFKDNTGAWSGVLTQYFMKYNSTPIIIPNTVVGFRFWMDDDPGSMETYSFMQPTQFVRWADTLDMPFLETGPHILNYQFRDTNNFYSSVRSDTFNVISCLPYSGRVIAGQANVCVGQSSVIYSIRKIKNAFSYTWSLPTGASIVSGMNTHSIEVDYSLTALSGEITVFATNPCGNGDTITLPISVHQLPQPSLTGEGTVCSTVPGNVYSTEIGKTAYTWTVSDGNSITSGGTSASPTATVVWSSPGMQWIKVNYTDVYGCRDTIDTQLNVFVKQTPTPTISGPGSVCFGTTNLVYTTQPGMTNYTWSISPGGIITDGGSLTSNTVTVTWNTSGVKWVKVNYTNAEGCQGLAATQYNVSVNPLPAPTMNSVAKACLNSPVTYQTQTGMTNYTWSISPGANILAGGTPASYNVTLMWTTLGPHSVSVNYTNTNGCTGQTPAIVNTEVVGLPTPSLSGPTVVCKGSTGNIYSTESGMPAYAWWVSSGGTIVGSSTGSSISVTWISSGNRFVRVNYANLNGCQAANYTQLNVLVNPQPVPVITGMQTACAGTTSIQYATQSGMTGYTWNTSPGGTIIGSQNNSTLSVEWNVAGPQWVSVNYSDANGCIAASPTQYNVTVNPVPVPGLWGPTEVCLDSTGNIYSTDAGMSDYTWTFMNGMLVNGGGSNNNTIEVKWLTQGSQTISVSYTDIAAGCPPGDPTFLNLNVNTVAGIAGNITGPQQVNQGQSGVAYSVASVPTATGYSWILPPGAVIASGQNTNSITVDFSPFASSGNIYVSAYNLCGSQGQSPMHYVQVIPTAMSLQNQTVANGQVQCFNAFQTILVGGDGTMFTVNSGGSATMIAGVNILYRPTTNVLSGGYMNGYITTTGQFCGSKSAPFIATIDKEQEKQAFTASHSFKIYPNPTSGSFTIEFSKGIPEKAQIIIYNMQGEKLSELDIAAKRSYTISLSGKPSGLYFVRMQSSGTSETVRVIKQ